MKKVLADRAGGHGINFNSTRAEPMQQGSAVKFTSPATAARISTQAYIPQAESTEQLSTISHSPNIPDAVEDVLGELSYPLCDHYGAKPPAYAFWPNYWPMILANLRTVQHRFIKTPIAGRKP
jgi:hypothetical protein